MSNVKVSVIIPVYNVENYLRESLDCVVNQTLKEIEIICVDDGSTDKSFDILEEYAQKDSRIKILQQQNQFAGVARNNGLKVATGEYVIFLDSDDIFDLTMLEKMYNRAIETSADVTVCDSKFFIEDIKNVYETYGIRYDKLPEKEVFSSKEIKNNDVYQAFVGWVWDKLYKREFILNNGLEFQGLRSSNDMFFGFISLIMADKISLLKESLVFYRKNNPNSIGATRTKFSTYFYEALSAMKQFLIEKELFDLYRSSYYNYVMEFGIRLFNMLYSYQELSKMYFYLRDIVFNSDEMAIVLKSKHYNKKEYKLFNIVKHCPNYTLLPLFYSKALFSISNTAYNLKKVITLFGHKFCIRGKNV